MVGAVRRRARDSRSAPPHQQHNTADIDQQRTHSNEPRRHPRPQPRRQSQRHQRKQIRDTATHETQLLLLADSLPPTVCATILSSFLHQRKSDFDSLCIGTSRPQHYFPFQLFYGLLNICYWNSVHSFKPFFCFLVLCPNGVYLFLATYSSSWSQSHWC